MKAKCKRWLGLIMAALALTIISVPVESAEKQSKGDNKVAVVNDTVITRNDFDREVTALKQFYKSKGKPLDDSQISNLKTKVMENLIDRELLYQESRKKGVTVDASVTDEQFNKWKKQFSNDEELKNALSQMNLSTAEVKNQIKQRMTVQRFIEDQVVKKINVTEKELKTYYESHLDSFKRGEEVRASHILIKVDPSAEESKKKEAREKIEMVQKKLQKGEEFTSLAKEFSKCPSSSNGGDLGYFTRGKMVGPFDKVAFTLKPGEVSNIVETEFGYHLIKVIDKKPATTAGFEEIKSKIEQYLKQKKIREEITLYTKKIKEKAKVERFLTGD